jgi:hypothetical protein
MTTCIDPSEIQEGDLLAYAEGQASAEVQAHVRRCTHCAGRAEAYARRECQLRAGLYRAACPPSTGLARWQLHLLPADEALVVAAHVRVCPHCTRELEELAAVDDAVLAMFLERLQGVRRWAEATAVAAVPRSAGLRGAASPQRRYRAGDVDVFVASQAGARGRRLRGRLRATPNADIEIWLAQGDNIVDHRRTDAQGRFVFSSLAPGRYALGFAWRGQAVLVRDVEV